MNNARIYSLDDLIVDGARFARVRKNEGYEYLVIENIDDDVFSVELHYVSSRAELIRDWL